jgi:DNA mismatch repair protein MutL
LLMTGRYPVAFLFLELAPERVDVNIHPTKTEVRFRDSQALYRQLLSTLRTRFLSANLESPVSLGGAGRWSAPTPPVDPQAQRAAQQDLAAWAKEQLDHWTPAPANEPAFDSGMQLFSDGPGETAEWISRGSLPARDPFAGWPGPRQGDDSRAPTAPLEEPLPSLTAPADSLSERLGAASSTTKPRQVMQVHDCYLVVETEDGITVIDQHALHERVMYEHLRARVAQGAVESQRSLVPQTLELPPREVAALLENRDLLSQLGYGVEEFGGATALLVASPAMLAHADHAQILRDIAEQLATAGHKPSRRDILDGLLHMMACKAAVKAGQRLKPEEMESLLAQRHLIDDAHHCPHGRPTALVLTRTELDRQFGRLG